MIVLLLGISAPIAMMLLHLVVQRTVCSAAEPRARLRLVIRIVMSVTMIWGVLATAVLSWLPLPLLLLNAGYVIVVSFGLGLCYFNVFRAQRDRPADSHPDGVVPRWSGQRDGLGPRNPPIVQRRGHDPYQDRPTSRHAGGAGTRWKDRHDQSPHGPDRETLPHDQISLVQGTLWAHAGRPNRRRLAGPVAKHTTTILLSRRFWPFIDLSLTNERDISRLARQLQVEQNRVAIVENGVTIPRKIKKILMG